MEQETCQVCQEKIEKGFKLFRKIEKHLSKASMEARGAILLELINYHPIFVLNEEGEAIGMLNPESIAFNGNNIGFKFK